MTKLHAPLVMLAIVSIASVTACSDDGNGTGNGDQDVTADGITPDTQGDGSGDDADSTGPQDVTSDQGQEDIEIVEGGTGWPCQNNSDCNSGYCVEGPEGYVCTNTCVEECPNGYDCKSVVSGSSDVVFLCVPRFQKLCVPCTADLQCAGGSCLDLDGERQCSFQCDPDASPTGCPQGYGCGPDPTGDHEGNFCLPISGSCSCTPDTVGAQRSCQNDNGIGTCIGIETCDADLGWTGCTAAEPAEEECNGADDDCDGLIDEDLPKNEPCENVVEDVGSCPGVRVCQGINGWLCQGPVPSGETCDFQDNDCDGETDEDFKSGDAYTGFDHCGTCNASCGNGFPNAEVVECTVFGTQPQCAVVECSEGYTKANDFQCLPDAASICQPCATDSNCLGNGAACVTLGEGSYCGQACVTVDDCPPGYSCDDVGAAQNQCVPTSGSCSCDGTNLELQRSCKETFTPADPNQPAYTCVGFEQCTVDGWGSCQLPVEECDGVDNNCDGVVDEGFVNGSGVYDKVEHCGGCNLSCLALSYPNASPLCDVGGSVPQCDYECDADWFDVNGLASDGCECQPQAGDDLAGDGVDSNCDGIDGDISQGVFVAKDGTDAAPGTIDEPMLTIEAGLQKAFDTGKRDVYVATGVYSESVILRPGIGLFGGYSSDFLTRNVITFETAIIGQDPTGQKPGAVTAVSLGNDAQVTVLDGFTIFGANAANVTGANSYAVYLSGCGSNLTIAHNRIFGGAGGNGANGSNGTDGFDGVDGSPGVDAYDTGNNQCGTSDEADGGSGGSLTCGDGTNVSGGDGGDSECPSSNVSNVTTTPPAANEFGADGNGPSSGSGGVAGWDGVISDAPCNCSVNGEEAAAGGPGSEGGDGSDGMAGNGCSDADGTVSGGNWQAGTGSPGVSGGNGGGGGGGGSGRSVLVDETATFNAGPPLGNTSCADPQIAGGDDIGGTGGGGGSGGCGATGGAAGGGGGGSFGVFLVYSSAPSSVPAIADNTIRRGKGGSGGAGGPGGAGGQPGAGGVGGSFTPSLFCAADGGVGGDGGRGGHGGGGGGGCGGASYGIFVYQAGGSQDVSGYASGNSFLPGGDGGPGGPGGASLGNSGGPGSTGAAADTNF